MPFIGSQSCHHRSQQSCLAYHLLGNGRKSRAVVSIVHSTTTYYKVRTSLARVSTRRTAESAQVRGHKREAASILWPAGITNVRNMINVLALCVQHCQMTTTGAANQMEYQTAHRNCRGGCHRVKMLGIQRIPSTAKANPHGLKPSLENKKNHHWVSSTHFGMRCALFNLQATICTRAWDANSIPWVRKNPLRGSK